MSSEKLKVRWTWEEWQAARALRRAQSWKVVPRSIRRKECSSDRRLRETFGGERGPELVPKKKE